MKMIYQIKPTKRSFFSKNLLKVTLILLLILIFVFVFNISGTRSFVGQIFSPLFRVGNLFLGGLNRVPKFFYDKNELIKENEGLLYEIENNRLDAISCESVKYENQKLREELKIKPTKDFITASIMAKPPQIPLDSLFLSEGTSKGLSNGDLVLAREKVLIGRIVRVDKNRATVALSSFAGLVSHGYLARTDEPLEIKGAGGGGMEAKVSIDFDIIIGDEIIVGGLPGHLMAVVEAIEENHSSGFKNILMSLPVNTSKINIVFVESAIDE